MESKRLLECLESDYTRLRDVARAADLTARVPSCPEWSIGDLVQHVGLVYLHKVECMRTGDHPSEWPPAAALAEPPVLLLERAYADLTAEFATRDPAQPTFTWYGPDQSVGFWIRRMAQETVIHRVDAELGAGVPLAQIPPDLAVDGIDELLVAFVEFGSREWPDEYAELLGTADGAAVRVEAGDEAAWFVRPTPEGVEVRRSDVDTTEAVVRGEPAPALLWLWNRADDGAVAISGDHELVSGLRKILVASTG